MTLIISKGITLRKTWQPMDSDAAAYIAAVEAADTEPLEEKTKIAIDNFVLGCKADGIWNAIKASCILAGARTLTGALVPLVGTAPTNVGGLFVSDDYNRKTGLVGNGSTKYLDSNRNNNVDPQNSNHICVYVSSLVGPGSGFRGFMGAGNSNPETNIFFNDITSQIGSRSRSGPEGNTIELGSVLAAGIFGLNRSVSSAFSVRANGAVYTVNRDSKSPSNFNVWVFAVNRNNVPTVPTPSRLAFYSIGESLDLALLDARITDLINAFGAAIP
jgi:hypothetical protein